MTYKTLVCGLEICARLLPPNTTYFPLFIVQELYFQEKNHWQGTNLKT